MYGTLNRVYRVVPFLNNGQTQFWNNLNYEPKYRLLSLDPFIYNYLGQIFLPNVISRFIHFLPIGQICEMIINIYIDHRYLSFTKASFEKKRKAIVYRASHVFFLQYLR